jgi:phosphoribosyl 1,2-cyclic phosphodiesterase
VTGTLKFLGTAGARFVVSTQLRHSGGLVWTLGDFALWVDPGPGALVRALSSRPRVDPAKVDALLVTHRHLDHAGDATAVVEAMTRGGFEPRGALYAPAEALGEEPVVARYAHRFLARIERLAEGGRHQLAPDLALETPLLHDHGVETYGYVLRAPGFAAGHVVDTFWMERLPAAYAGLDLLLLNVTRREGGDRRMLHLGIGDAERLVAGARPKLAVLTHFGMQLVRDGPEAAALRVSERTGVPTIAARDGMLLPLPPPLDLPARTGRPARAPAKVRG